MRRVILLALAAASLAAGAVNPAAAAPAGKGTEQTSISVRFGDLNLADREGARTLVSRIRVAANELCGPELVGDLGRMADRTKCVRATEERAIHVVNRPAVTAAYFDRRQPGVVALANSSR